MRTMFTGLVALFAIGAVGCFGGRPAILRPKSVPVPPSQEIEILDPGQSSTHVPAVILAGANEGSQKVDVPPAVLVHRYYPSGDRTFQAQFLPGGPTIVSVNHPRTLERTYVTVTMPPGAPEVTYRRKSIIYDFGPQSVTIHFGPLGAPTVFYSQGNKLVEGVKSVAENVKERVKDLLNPPSNADVLRD